MYRTSTNQREVPPDQVRYELDCTVNGKRYRRRVVCRTIDIVHIHDSWLAGCHGRPTEALVMLYEAIDNYLYERSPEKSPKQYKTELSFFKRFKELIPDLPLNAVAPWHVGEYFKGRKDRREGPGYEGPLSRSTHNKDLNILSSFFRWCIAREFYTRANPCPSFRLSEQNERHITVDVEHVREVLSLSQELGIAVPVALSVYAGLRLQEVLTLRWVDLDFRSRRIHVRGEIEKTRRHRYVPMSDNLHEVLLAAYQDKNRGEKVAGHTHQTLRRRWRKLQSRLSWASALPGGRLHYHDLRHIFAQALRDSGVDLGDVAAFLGHTSIQTTVRRYAQAGGYDGLKKINRIDDMLG